MVSADEESVDISRPRLARPDDAAFLLERKKVISTARPRRGGFLDAACTGAPCAWYGFDPAKLSSSPAGVSSPTPPSREVLATDPEAGGEVVESARASCLELLLRNRMRTSFIRLEDPTLTHAFVMPTPAKESRSPNVRIVMRVWMAVMGASYPSARSGSPASSA